MKTPAGTRKSQAYHKLLFEDVERDRGYVHDHFL